MGEAERWSPSELRQACRAGRWDRPTAGLAGGFVQANLIGRSPGGRDAAVRGDNTLMELRGANLVEMIEREFNASLRES